MATYCLHQFSTIVKIPSWTWASMSFRTRRSRVQSKRKLLTGLCIFIGHSKVIHFLKMVTVIKMKIWRRQQLFSYSPRSNRQSEQLLRHSVRCQQITRSKTTSFTNSNLQLKSKEVDTFSLLNTLLIILVSCLLKFKSLICHLAKE